MSYDRKSDTLIEVVNQKLEDHMAETKKSFWEIKDNQAEHNEWCRTEFETLRKEMGPIQSAFNAVERPVKWVGWIVLITLTSALTETGIKLAHWVEKHFH